MSYLRAMEMSCSILPADGSPAQNKKYCSKELDFEEFGVMPDPQAKIKAGGLAGAQATKNKYEQFIQLAKASDFDALEVGENASMYVRYFGAAKGIAQSARHTPKDLPGVCGYWLYGPSGSGKTYLARNALAKGEILRKDGKSDFFQGLKQSSKTLIWEEYERNNTIIDRKGYLLKLIGDEIPFEANVKNGGDLFRPERAIVTSNYTIDHCFPVDGPHADLDLNESIHRRFHEVRILSMFEVPPDTPMFNPQQAARPYPATHPVQEGTWYSRYLPPKQLKVVQTPIHKGCWDPVHNPITIDLTQDDSSDHEIIFNDSPPRLNTQEDTASDSSDLGYYSKDEDDLNEDKEIYL